jgi:hypothetical protein
MRSRCSLFGVEVEVEVRCWGSGEFCSSLFGFHVGFHIHLRQCESNLSLSLPWIRLSKVSMRVLAKSVTM